MADTTSPAAAGTVSDAAVEAPRRRRRDVTVTAPTDMSAFAVVSGDHNPIHTDRAAALLAGLKGPIVHGMWLSAAAQQVVERELGRLDQRTPDMSAEHRAEVERAVHRIVDKLLHQPTVRAKELAVDGRLGEYEDALRQLFDLHADGGVL